MDKDNRNTSDPVRMLNESYLMGQCLEIYESQEVYEDSVDFEIAAGSMYSNNLILIGYRNEHSMEILPSYMPIGSHALVIAENLKRVNSVNVNKNV